MRKVTSLGENIRRVWAYVVECETCGWYNVSQDYYYTVNAGTVHQYRLTTGHNVLEVERITKA